MRALFEDIPNNTGAVTNAAIKVAEVGFPAVLPNSRRDLWFSFTRASGTEITAKAYRDRAQTSAEYVASATITVGASPQTVTFARNGTKTPDLTGLVIIGTFTTAPASGVYYWGYTAAPDLVVCDNIVTLLKARTSVNQSLYGIGSNIYTGDETEAEAMPLIAVVAQPVELDLSANVGSTMTLVCPIEVHVGIDMLADPGTAWRKCREYMASVESILHDENRRSYGECHTLYRQSSQGPGPAASKPTVMVGVVRVAAVFPYVWRDDAYPRG